MFAWPVLESGNSSYQEGAYSVQVTQGEPGRSFQLTHTITGAGLIQHWIGEGRVLFVCTVASPISAYRTVHSSAQPSQDVGWDPDDLGEPPKFTPMIVSAGDIEHTISADSDGIAPQWDGRTIRLQKGSRIAICPTFALRSGLIGLFDFELAEHFAMGTFKVEASTEEGFRFKVRLAEDLFNYLRLQYQRQEAAGANIMTHIVSSAFSHLRSDFRDDDGASEGWHSFSSLRSLADLLATKNLGHWGDENFDAEYAATHLYPHKLDDQGGMVSD